MFVYMCVLSLKLSVRSGMCKHVWYGMVLVCIEDFRFIIAARRFSFFSFLNFGPAWGLAHSITTFL